MNVSINFDDGLDIIHEVAFSIMEKYGFKATVFPITDALKGNLKPMDWGRNDEHNYGIKTKPMTLNDVWKLYEHGWEMGCHTKTHRVLTRLTDEEVCSEFEESTKYFVECGLPRPTVLAYPGGFYNSSVVGIAKKYFKCARGFSEKPIELNDLGNLRLYELKAIAIDDFKDLLSMDYFLDGWLIVVNHVLKDKEGFDDWLKMLDKNGVDVVLFKDVVR